MAKRGRSLGILCVLITAACSPSGGKATVTSSSAATTVAVSSTEPSVSTSTSAAPTTTAAAPQTTTTISYPPIEPGGEVPVDAGVRIGTLPNGLTYYLRSNDNPGGSVSLRLAINAGSALEQPDQAGVAHFLEHMLFNGTTKYPKNELVSLLQGFGATFGPDVNAYTSYDETVYELTVPPDRKPLGAAIDVLHEWLTAATLAQTDVESERGVVLDEWRQRQQSSSGRTFDAVSGLFLGGTAYDGRQPIGNDAAISAMTSDLVRRFYDRWYRPDNAAVVIVGSINVDEVEKTLTAVFGDAAPRTADPLDRPAATWTKSATAAQSAVHLDPDVTEAQAEITLPATSNVGPGQPAHVGLMQDSFVVSLALQAITNRLSDDIRLGTSSANSADIDDNSVIRPLDAPGVVVSADPAQLDATVDGLITEFQRVAALGFTQPEVDRVVTAARTSLQSNLDGSASTQDPVFANDYVGHFLSGAPIPDARTQFDILTAALDQLTPASLALSFNRRLQLAKPYVLVTGPDDVRPAPTAATVLARVAAIGAKQPAARTDTSAPVEALMQRPEGVQEATSKKLPSEGGFIHPVLLTFPNGADVVLNAGSGVSDDYVQFYGRRVGGSDALTDDLVPAANLLSGLVAESGLGDLNPVQVSQYLAASSSDVSLYLQSGEEGFFGSTNKADLEDAFAYVNLAMTRPAVTPVGLRIAKSTAQATAAQVTSDEQSAATQATSVGLFGDTPRYRYLPTAVEIDGVTAEQSQHVLAQRFGTAAGWRFVVSGDFTFDEGVALARAYIGTLPGGDATGTPVSQPRFGPGSIVATTVNAGTGDRALLNVAFNVPVDGNIASARAQADVLAAVLTNRFTTVIREALGASYSPDATVHVTLTPPASSYANIQITGSPAQMEQIAQIVNDQLADIRTNGVSSAEFNTAVAGVQREYGFQSDYQIALAAMDGQLDPTSLQDYANRTTRSIKQGDIAAIAQRFLPADNSVQITVLPAG